jgi:hypothetical protein
MSEAPVQEYAVTLCYMRDGEVVPYELKQVTASDDNEALLKATEWVASFNEMIGEQTWLVVKQGARGVHSKRLS